MRPGAAAETARADYDSAAAAQEGAVLLQSGQAGNLPAFDAAVGVVASGGPLHDPVYGDQLNTSAVQGVKPEGRVRLRWQAVKGRFADGSRATGAQSLANAMVARLRDSTVRTRLREERGEWGSRRPEKVLLDAVRTDSLKKYQGLRLDSIATLRARGDDVTPVLARGPQQQALDLPSGRPPREKTRRALRSGEQPGFDQDGIASSKLSDISIGDDARKGGRPVSA